MPRADTDAELTHILSTHKRVAVLGAHPDPQKASHYVPAYLADHGFGVWPVNGARAEGELFGKPVRARLTELEEPVEMVVMFRRSDKLPEHLDEVLGMSPLPKVVWLQLGIRNETFADQLVDKGLTVVQDHCAMAEHKRLIGS